MRRKLLAGFTAMMIVMAGAPAWAKRELSDLQLDSVVAGTVTTDGQGNFTWAGANYTANGKVSAEPLPGVSNSLYAIDTSQQGLINITAINSAITVSLNLNVNINSTINSVIQKNIHLP